MTTRPGADQDAVSWTNRQREVLDLLAKGLTNGQIAEALGISLDGAKWHVSEIIARLGVDTREEAAEYWRKQNGLVWRLRSSVRRRVSHSALAWLGACGVAATLAVAAPLVFLTRGDDPPARGAWQRLPDGPLSARTSVLGVWTGSEVLFVGGDVSLCPPGANCLPPTTAALADGAALDPDTGDWRVIAPAPAPFDFASTAAIQDEVFFLANVRGADLVRRVALFRYAVGDDRWDESEVPAQVADGGYRLAGADDLLVAYATEHGPDAKPDFLFDPATEAWSELPPHPVLPGFDLSMQFADGRLFVFDVPATPVPGAREPALVRVSRFDFAAGTWESLGTTGMLTGHGFVSWGVFVVPALGGADGGAVDNWGRMYPNGGMVDLATGEWTPLPNLPDTGKDAIAAGAFDSVDAMYTGVNGGWLLDLDSGEWARMPRIDPPGTGAQRRVTTAGRNPVVFGGARCGQGASAAGEALADAWIWRAP